MAVVPVIPLSVARVALVAKVAVKDTIKTFPGATFKVSGCKLTAPRYGQCSFYVVGHFNEKSTGLQKCSGTVQVRNIGKGYERRFVVKGCKAV